MRRISPEARSLLYEVGYILAMVGFAKVNPELFGKVWVSINVVLLTLSVCVLIVVLNIVSQQRQERGRRGGDNHRSLF